MIAGSVQLQELDASGGVIAVVGQLHDDGLNGDVRANDNIWTVRTALTEDSSGPVALRVSAAFKGSLVRSYSASTVVNVTGSANGASFAGFTRPANFTVRAHPAAQAPNTTLLDYETFADNTALTTQYPGIVFSNALVLRSGISLNEFEFPPHSGSNVVSDSGGPMTIALSVPVAGFSGYFTYNVPVVVNAYDGNNVLVATVNSHFTNNQAISGAAGTSANDLLQISYPAGISKITITGAPGGSSFTLDDTVLGAPTVVTPPPPPPVTVPPTPPAGPPPLQISGLSNLGTIGLGSSLSGALFATGGTPPYTFSSLGPLPSGVTLTTDGKIGGKPTQLGPNSFTATVTDAQAITTGTSISFSVFGITTTSLPAATALVSYSQVLAATGGVPPYNSWSVASGSLPPGLSLNSSSGTITGTPTGQVTASTFTFSVTVQDGAGHTPQAQTLTINVSALPGPAITSLSPASAPAGSASVTVTISGSGFAADTVAQWNGLSLTTTYLTPTSLTATIPASDLTTQGTGQVTAVSGTSAVSNSFPFVVSSVSPLQFLTVTPCRIMDTRNPNGPLGGPFIGGGTSRTIPIPSACGLPANASAYSLNFTVVPRAAALSYLSVWPTGQPQPFVSTLNSLDGSVIANAAIVPAGAAGAIDAFASNDTELIVDVNGYFVQPNVGANTLQFYPLPPCRVLDTRNPAGNFGGPSIAGGSSRSFPITASPCGVPATAVAYAFNTTVVPVGSLAYLTAWPTGQAQPVVSTLNSFGGTVLANAAIVPAGTAGAVSFFASNTTDLVVDINGYFAPPGSGGLNFYSVTPCRLVDTRNAAGPFGGPIMGAATTRVFPLAQGSCGLPGSPGGQAYSLNVTVVPQTPLAYLSIWPDGQTQPGVSTLNAFKGQIVANAAIVPVSSPGSIDVYVTNKTDVVIDTNGYFGQ